VRYARGPWPGSITNDIKVGLATNLLLDRDSLVVNGCERGCILISLRAIKVGPVRSNLGAKRGYHQNPASKSLLVPPHSPGGCTVHDSVHSWWISGIPTTFPSVLWNASPVER